MPTNLRKAAVEENFMPRVRSEAVGGGRSAAVVSRSLAASPRPGAPRPRLLETLLGSSDTEDREEREPDFLFFFFLSFASLPSSDSFSFFFFFFKTPSFLGSTVVSKHFLANLFFFFFFLEPFSST